MHQKGGAHTGEESDNTLRVAYLVSLDTAVNKGDAARSRPSTGQFRNATHLKESRHGGVGGPVGDEEAHVLEAHLRGPRSHGCCRLLPHPGGHCTAHHYTVSQAVYPIGHTHRRGRSLHCRHCWGETLLLLTRGGPSREPPYLCWARQYSPLDPRTTSIQEWLPLAVVTCTGDAPLCANP